MDFVLDVRPLLDELLAAANQRPPFPHLWWGHVAFGPHTNPMGVGEFLCIDRVDLLRGFGDPASPQGIDKRAVDVLVEAVIYRVIVARRFNGRLRSGLFFGDLVELIVRDVAIIHRFLHRRPRQPAKSICENECPRFRGHVLVHLWSGQREPEC